MQRDYLMHQIESFAHALAQILGLASLRRYDEAIEVINQTAKQNFRLDLDTIPSLSHEDLEAHLRMTYAPEDLDRKRFEIASLLKQAGNIYTASGREQQSERACLAGLALLLDAGDTDVAFATTYVAPLIDELATALAGCTLPLQTGKRLIDHYERQGRYGSAEDILFDLLDAYPSDAPLLDRGVRLYELLRLCDDDALLAGNLPREEVEAGLAELRLRSIPE